MPTQITTERLILRPFQTEDVEDALAYRDDVEFARFLVHVPQPFTRGDAEAFVARTMAEPWDRSPTFAVVLEGRVIGTVNFEVNATTHTAMIGYAIGRAWWGRGIATEAGRATMAWAIEGFDLARVWASTELGNVRSQRVLEKLGMRRESVRVARSHRARRQGRRRSRVRAQRGSPSVGPRRWCERQKEIAGRTRSGMLHSLRGMPRPPPAYDSSMGAPHASTPLLLLAVLALAGCDTRSSKSSKESAQGELGWAVSTGDLARARAALVAGADPDSSSGVTEPPIVTSAERDDTALVDELLRWGASPLGKAYDGRTTVHAAARAGDVGLVSLFLARGVPAGAVADSGTALYDAAVSGDEPTLRLLLARGLDPRDQANRYRLAPLHGAAKGGHAGAIRALVSAGGDVHAVDNGEMTPLHWATTSDAVDALVAAGADVEAHGPGHGMRPLHSVFEGGAIGAILAHGADPNATMVDGSTPLHRHGCDAAIRARLVAAGADPTRANAKGEVPPAPGTPGCQHKRHTRR
jgi:ribosomal-protein-alanine N-acetyltransferase